MTIENSFLTELSELINRRSLENRSNTPDYILASFLETCLNAFDESVKVRDKWYGKSRLKDKVETKEHKCKYCGAMTTQTDEVCYANPEKQIKDTQDGTANEIFNLKIKKMNQEELLQLESNQRQHNQDLEHQSKMNMLVAQEEYNLFALLKPKLVKDGNSWCCLYGNNLHDGIAGFGDTPYKAIIEWNKEWHKQ